MKSSARTLRQEAERRVQARVEGERALGLNESMRLLHELQVHQVELELQNEELAQTRAALEVSLAQYADLYDFAPVAYLTLDACGSGIVALNLAAARLLGQPREQLIGADFTSFLSSELRTLFGAFLERVQQSATRETIETTLLGNLSAPAPCRVEGLAIEGTQHCRVVLWDLTEQRQLEARARHGEKMTAVALLAGGVAHEINNPLSYVMEGLETLRDELPTVAPERTDLLELATDAWDGTARIRDVVKNLKTFSRPLSKVRGAVDLGDELAAALRLAAAELRQRAQVTTKLGPMPRVTAAPHELGQVFLNLLINAAQSCPEGQASEHRITVSSGTDASGQAVIEVSDTGSGMSPALCARIFEPYFTTKAQGVGTGLGLTVAHGIIAGVGGRIEVFSEPGRGSTFRVSLPPAVDIEAVPTPLPSGQLPVASPGGLSVLVVDDEPSVASAVARCLARGNTVTLAHSGAEALAQLDNGKHFDVVVCDLMMPEISGQVLQERVAERLPLLAKHFIFLTGGAFTSSARRFTEQTSCVSLEKPFAPAELLAAVMRVGFDQA